MEVIKSCPICNNPEYSHFISCKDYTVSRETFSIVRCDKCGFLFTNPRPDISHIGEYYKSEDYVSHSNTSKGLINKLYKGVRKYTLGRKLKLINSLSAKGIVLDIGCGTGEFLYTCKSAGWRTLGVEPDAGARKFGAENYGLDVKEESSLSTLPSGNYDIITMWHVLEHVYNLKDRVNELKRLLKESGRIIVAVPNSSSLDASYYKESWAAYDVPRHLYHFRPQDIERLFGDSGMKVEKVMPMKFDSYYVSMLSEKYTSGKPNLIKALLKGFASNRSASSDERSYSSQIYIIKKVNS